MEREIDLKILIACNHFPVASGRYMMDAFRRLGHEVRTVGEAMGVNIWGMTVEAKYEWKPDSDIPGADVDWPDLIVVMDSDTYVWAQVQLHWTDTDTKIVVYGVDNHARDYEHEVFDHYFLAHYHGPTYPVDPTRKDHTWLPCATDAKLFTPSPIPWHEREYDVCMVGVMYPRRIEAVNALKDAGLKVFAATGLLYDEYRAAYHNSRISLCVSAAGDVAQRIFETGGMGCAVLTDPLLDLEDPVTNRTLGLSGFAVYSNPSEAVMLAKDMLATKVEYFNLNDATDPNEPSAGKHGAQRMLATCKSHTWEARAQVIVNWFEREYGKVKTVEVKPTEILLPFLPGIPNEGKQEYIDAAKALANAPTMAEAEQMLADVSTALNAPVEPNPARNPFLNLGCGRIILPGERPDHHGLIPEPIYQNEHWVNIDRAGTVNAGQIFDLFTYPWPLESNSYDGALLTHLCEHIPHEIKYSIMSFGWRDDLPDNMKKIWNDIHAIGKLQDGWFAFFSELYRVLTPSAEVHILSPHARSDGAISDPTHTRYLLPESFNHSMQPNPDAPFEYATGGIHFETQQVIQGINPEFAHLSPPQIEYAVRTQYNICTEFYVRLKVVK